MREVESERRRRFDALFASYGSDIVAYCVRLCRHDQAADPAAPLNASVTVGADGVVREIAVTWGTWTYTVAYSRLGATPAPVAPENATPLRRLRTPWLGTAKSRRGAGEPAPRRSGHAEVGRRRRHRTVDRAPPGSRVRRESHDVGVAATDRPQIFVQRVVRRGGGLQRNAPAALQNFEVA